MHWEKTVELDRSEILAALRRSKEPAVEPEESGSAEPVPPEQLREAVAVIRRWAEEHDQWLVVLAPWGLQHYGRLTEAQVDEILRRFAPEGG
jgi:hypothetical protein